MNEPILSVVLAVYNGERYLAEAIRSILDQSYQDFELIIVSEHDTSTESLEIISSFPDERIVHIHNAEKLGLVRSLNLAMSKAHGRFIARMDSDDICEKDRFGRQVRFLEERPDIAAVGSDIVMIDGDGKRIAKIRYPHHPLVIGWEMYYRSAIANSSVMLRSEVIKITGAYDEGTPLAEDYCLWLRLLKISKIANLPKSLLRYRVHGHNVSTVREEEMEGIADRLACEAIAELIGESPSKEAVACLRDRSRIRTASQGKQAAELLIVMHRRYIQLHLSTWIDLVCIHAVTLRLQIAISLRFIRSDWRGALRTIWCSISLSPITALPAIIYAAGELFAYRRKMRKLGLMLRAEGTLKDLDFVKEIYTGLTTDRKSVV